MLWEWANTIEWIKVKISYNQSWCNNIQMNSRETKKENCMDYILREQIWRSAKDLWLYIWLICKIELDQVKYSPSFWAYFGLLYKTDIDQTITLSSSYPDKLSKNLCTQRSTDSFCIHYANTSFLLKYFKKKSSFNQESFSPEDTEDEQIFIFINYWLWFVNHFLHYLWKMWNISWA